jgi:hypothetical protein
MNGIANRDGDYMLGARFSTGFGGDKYDGEVGAVSVGMSSDAPNPTGSAGKANQLPINRVER